MRKFEINCDVYPTTDYLDFNDNRWSEDGNLDLRVTQNNQTCAVSLTPKTVKKLRKQLKKYLKEFELHHGRD